MGGGRKNLKREVEEEMGDLLEGHSVMQVVSLRGNNQLEVMDGNGEKLLANFPAKFQKSMWTKRGNFVVVNESGRKEAVESGSKVCGMVTRVLYHEQVRVLQKAPEWPAIFKSQSIEKPIIDKLPSSSHNKEDDEASSSDDDGLPPLEANTNRVNPLDAYVESGSESDSDSDNVS